jgi:sterol 3beta-glucosyltransferase
VRWSVNEIEHLLALNNGTINPRGVNSVRAVLANFGTSGDLIPFLVLADELRRHNHQPVLAFSPNCKAHIESLGMEYFPLGPDLLAAQRNINAAMMRPPGSAEEMFQLVAPLMSAMPQIYEELSRVSASSDVLICGSSLPVGRIVHEVTGIPFVSIQLSHFGAAGTSPFQEACALYINQFRARHRLPALGSPLTDDSFSPQLSLFAMSRHVQPPQVNWPGHYHMTGYFFPEDEIWQPSDALRKFIEAGEPPVVITFGSMEHEDPEALTRLLVKSIDLLHCRAVIQHGWSGLGASRLPSNIFATDFIPHDWLFQRAACIVHAGGGGTAGMVFRSGAPSVFVPHTAFDQAYWALIAEDLGCAAPAIPYQSLSAERLADAISTILTNPQYRQNAMELSLKIRSEGGVRVARRLIEQLVCNIPNFKGPPRSKSQESHSRIVENTSHVRQNQPKYLDNTANGEASTQALRQAELREQRANRRRAYQQNAVRKPK